MRKTPGRVGLGPPFLIGGASPALLILLFCFFASAGELIQVRVLSKYSPTEVRVIPPEGEARKILVGEESYSAEASSRGSIRVEGKGFGTKEFWGKLTVSSRRGALFFLQEIPLESYVASVLASEIPPSSPMESLKAQAVLVRTYALKERGRHAAEGFDFCDLTHCQVFGGGGRDTDAVKQAVAATRGEILYFQGQAASVVFHSTCGGHTSANHAVFGGKPLPYLQGASDGKFCEDSAHGAWTASIPLKDLERALSRDPELEFRGPIREIRAGEREAEGRWFSVQLVGTNRIDVPVEKFLSRVGRELGWNRLKSGWFEVSLDGNIAIFFGHGLGHGVGLCQEGAIGMARQGRSYQEILGHYFPGTRIGLMK